jgi:hypothetical protein
MGYNGQEFIVLFNKGKMAALVENNQFGVGQRRVDAFSLRT